MSGRRGRSRKSAFLGRLDLGASTSRSAEAVAVSNNAGEQSDSAQLPSIGQDNSAEAIINSKRQLVKKKFKTKPVPKRHKRDNGQKQANISPEPAPAHDTQPQPRRRKGTPTKRCKPGIKALREIKRYQKSGELLIPKLPFLRLVKEITAGLNKPGCKDLRFQALAMKALHSAAEAYVIEDIEISNLLAIHAKRVTLMVCDMRLSSRLKDMLFKNIVPPVSHNF